MIKSTFNATLVRPIMFAYAFAAVVAIAIITLATSCYPKNCDPKTDPTGCQCPPGVCGPYPDVPPPPPVRGAGAGTEAGR